MTADTQAPDTAPTAAPEALIFTYTNWRGETAERRIRAHGAVFRFDATKWHPEPQWLLCGIDLDKMEGRSFAVRDIRFTPIAPAPTADMVLVPRAVLAPFADAARTFSGAIGPDGIDDELTVLARVHAMHGTEAHLSTGDFSRVASALAASPTPSLAPSDAQAALGHLYEIATSVGGDIAGDIRHHANTIMWAMTSPVQASPGVKELVWEHRPYAPSPWIASSAVGDYRIQGLGWRLNDGPWSGGMDDVEAAKAAAQADFTRRIQSCVTTPLAGEDSLETYYARQIEWSRETFGPALRTGGVIDHIRKELREIEADPHDLSEWVDVVILAMDGFWRHGGTATGLMPALLAKQAKNMARTWPDWRTMSENSAIEHDRSGETPLAGEAGANDWAQREAYRKGFEDGGRIECERADFLEAEVERLRSAGEAGAVAALREFSDAATPGRAWIDGDTADLYFCDPPGSPYIPDSVLVARCSTGDHYARNARFLAECVNFVRSALSLSPPEAETETGAEREASLVETVRRLTAHGIAAAHADDLIIDAPAETASERDRLGEDDTLLANAYLAMRDAMGVIDANEGPGLKYSRVLNALAASRVAIERRNAARAALSTETGR